MNRRDFLKSSIGLYIAGSAHRMLGVPLPGGTLDPTTVPKYVTPLAIPQVMPISSAGDIDYYEVAVRQFQQQILPPKLPRTTVFGYGSLKDGIFSYPGRTFEAKVNRPVRVKWINQLVDSSGKFLPHILPVDPTLHWANPPGPPDERPTFTTTPGPYTGPVPLVTHLHGAHAFEDSDGYPEAWYLPVAKNIPSGYSRVGTYYDRFRNEFKQRVGLDWPAGSAIYQYDNDQSACTLWYHDHSLGITRLNVHAGTAGFYLLRGGQQDLLPGMLPSGPFEIPILIQDRSFNKDGSLFFSNSRVFFDGFEGPYIPRSDIPPIWNPEFFANTMVVNGRTWPFLDVEPRRYRFRILNGCNARTLILRIAGSPPVDGKVSPAALPIWQIGADGGFLPDAVQLDRLLIMPAQRNDVIVDFSGLAPGTRLYLVNLAADEPFGGGEPGVDFAPSDAGTTGQVMQFRVVMPSSSDTTALPVSLPLPDAVALHPTITRKLSLNEFDSGGGPNPPGPQVFWNPDGTGRVPAGPRASFLGTVDRSGNPIPYEFMDEPTETPGVGATEVWELYNFTADAHPMHLHLVQFQLLNRQNLQLGADGLASAPARLRGSPIFPENWELGPKDTIAVYPGMVTRIQANFDRAGLYLWHCHILDHEDNDMMRPLKVG